MEAPLTIIDVDVDHAELVTTEVVINTALQVANHTRDHDKFVSYTVKPLSFEL